MKCGAVDKWISGGLMQGGVGKNIKGLVSEDDVPAEDGTTERGRDFCT